MTPATIPQELIDARVLDLADIAKRAGYLVTLENYVPAACVVALTGFAESTLRDWRATGRYAPRTRRFGGTRGRVQYDLRWVAELLIAAELDET